MKFLKSEVGFEHPAKGPHHCGQCVHFKPMPERCEIVAGVIHGSDWCDKFKRRPRKTPVKFAENLGGQHE